MPQKNFKAYSKKIIHLDMQTQAESSEPQNKAGQIIAVVCLLSLGYAILRYNILGSTPWKDLPFFVLKITSISSFSIIFFLGIINIK